MNKKLEDFDIFDINPFLEEVRIANILQSKDVKTTTPISLSVKDGTGKHVSSAFVRQNRKKFSDVREFTRIPVDGIIAMSDLEKLELKVFCYILANMEYNSLEIDLNVERIKEFYHYKSRTGIYKGIIGLLDKKFIAKRKVNKPIYYINPIFFYKGNLIQSFFDYLKENELKVFRLDNNDIKENVDFYKGEKTI